MPLRGLKTINVFNMDKATTWPISQSSRGRTSAVESLSTQNYPLALQSEFLRRTPPSDNSRTSDAPAPIQEDNMTFVFTPLSLVGRTWQSEMVLGSWTGSPVLNPGLAKGVYESQESEVWWILRGVI